MFIYNETDESYVDAERGIRVMPVGGPGHGIYSADVSGAGWDFRFIVRRGSDQVSSVGDETPISPEYRLDVFVTTFPVRGELDDPQLPQVIAREIALLRETNFFRTDPERISIS